MTHRSTPRIPSYRRHKPTNQAVVTLDGHDIYLGNWRSQRSRAEYDRLIKQWLDNGRELPKSDSAGLTITNLIVRYWKFAQKYYRKNGRRTGTCYGIKAALRVLRRSHGATFAADFGPLALKSLQLQMIDLGQSRRYINDNVDRIRRMFRWGVSEELVDAAVYQALTSVPGLRKGRTDARESPPVRPVDHHVVEATLPHLPPIVADMVRLQSLTGCRPGEICLLRPCDVEMTGDVWKFSPASHKTEHHDRARAIFIGPKGQLILRSYLTGEDTAYCFSPSQAEEQRNARRRANRRSPVTPSQSRRHPLPNRTSGPGKRYSTDSYRRAIERGCDKAFPPPPDLPDDRQIEWRRSHRWSPNRLRHATATAIRSRFGLEATQLVLGHARADISEIYAERDFSKAAAVIQEIG